jgi:hypothetical protein
MKALKITQTNGTYNLVPHDMVVSITLSAPDLTSDLHRWGRITAVKYLDGAALAAPTILAPTVTAYDGTNVRYQLVCVSEDGMHNQTYSS